MREASLDSNTESVGSGVGSGAELQELQQYYRQMWLIRRFEEECARAYAQGKIGGFLHLYIGQEAIAVGGSAAMQPDDYLITTYRDHGHALARGMETRAAMAELFGRDTGCSRGFGGSMHMFDAARGFLGGHGIVGGHLALAAGVAFKIKYQGERRVCLGYMGEGATNIGGFHEALSLAALCLGLMACTEQPQVSGTRKADQSPYATASSPYSTTEWKQGDAASWERSLNARAQRGQNEYGRTGPH